MTFDRCPAFAPIGAKGPIWVDMRQRACYHYNIANQHNGHNMTIEHESKLKTLFNMQGPHAQIPWPLPNLEQCTEFEYWNWMSTWGKPNEQMWSGGQIKIAETGAGHIGSNPRWANVFVSLIDHSNLVDGGFAVVFEYWAQPESERVRYYKWTACAHTFTSRNLGRCYNEYRCTKCGKAYTVDSSD